MPLRHENYSPLPPPSPVHAFTFSFIRALAIISTQFSLPFFPSFLSFSHMLYLNAENYILSESKRDFIFNKLSVEVKSSSHFPTLHRIDPRDCILVSFFSSPRHLYPFPPCAICFYFLARINIARSRTFTIPISLCIIYFYIPLLGLLFSFSLLLSPR